MGAKRKFYVVWAGRVPGIYDNWPDAHDQVDGFPGARFKAFDSCEDATLAFRKEADAADRLIFSRMAEKRNQQVVNYSAFPEICLDAISVDGACDRNPGGNVEYRGVRVGTGEEIFHVGPLVGGSNNIGEYIGLVHVLAFLQSQGDDTTPVYTDSRTALSWLRNRHNRSTVKIDPSLPLAKILARADAWVATHQWKNPVLKWNTELWGEIPADFGRK